MARRSAWSSGTIIAGPAGAVVAGAAGGLLHSLRSRFHDIGIDDKFMKQVAKEIEKGKSALFVQYRAAGPRRSG